ncbi:MAG: DUF1080 domain-containing protein [Verrucomicrobiae bacterium]|nr:DUF1080 domain-containing protein [Verrucomicrobiae bacterium]
MPRSPLTALLAAVVGLWSPAAPSHAAAPAAPALQQPEPVELFDGATLEGWDGDPRFWSVEDGAIVGRSTEEVPCEAPTCLLWRGGELADFALELDFLIRGGNSGVQFRCADREGSPWRVDGYQADIEDGPSWTGCLYDDGGRGVLVERGVSLRCDATGARAETRFAEGDALLAAVRPGEWNRYRIVARGPRVELFVNGARMCELVDHDPEHARRSGLVGLQLHGGAPMEVRFRDLRVERLAPAADEAKHGADDDAGAPTSAAAERLELREPRPEWLWPTEAPGDGERVGFFRAFELDAAPERAELFATCDNSFDLYVNDRLVASGGDWERGRRVDVAGALRAGANALKAECANESGAAGLLLALDLGGGRVLRSDGEWLAAVDPPNDWLADDFAPTGWSAPLRLGVYGVPPWGVLDVAREAQPEEGVLPAEALELAEGYRAELVYSVPRAREGSWVCMTFDERGRLIAGDQHGDLYRADVTRRPVRVERLDTELGAAQGVLCAFGALYVVVNGDRAEGSGLYRARDTDGDDRYDDVVRLKAFDGAGEHGPHAVVLGPDGTDLYVVAGNHTPLPPVDASRVPRCWGEDQLLPRLDDPNGHAVGVMAPGGWVCRTDPAGAWWELVACGMRNPYDLAFDPEGELFTYDADMEYDFNTPWYRPTRVNHVVSGSDYGWRNGTGKWAEWYVDSVPPAVNIGPGSPTGVSFAYGAKFPAKYQKALLIMDWSWGKLYAVHLQPEGSSYTGEKEELVTGVPLPLTDLVVHPGDGAVYFTIGGRKVQSGLYRLTYVGNEDTSPVDATTPGQKDRDFRKSIEAFHGQTGGDAINLAWRNLDHEDVFIRNAARVALEHQPANNWGRRAFRESDPGKQIPALLALARVRGTDPFHREPSDPPVNKAQGERIIGALAAIDYGKLSERHRQALTRTYHVVLNRFGRPSDELQDKIINQVDPYFPAETLESNRLLCELLVYLQAPHTAIKGIALLKTATTQEEQMEYARSLRMLTNGWTNALRTEYFEWFLKAANYRGGASFVAFIENIRKDAEDTLTDREREDLAEILARKPEIKSPLEAAMASLAGRTNFTNWKLEDLADAENHMDDRDFERGRRMFAAAACYSCHRFNNEGGATGPDLTSAGHRYSPRDFLDQIINPSKEINDQFVPVQVTMLDGSTVHGVIVNLSKDTVAINTDLTNPNQRTSVDRKMVKSIDTSPVSPMPPNLLGMLEKEEIYDLVAYVLSGGDRNDMRFQ